VVNGALDTVEAALAAVPGRAPVEAAGPGTGAGWELAWDSDWEHPAQGEPASAGPHDAAGPPGTALLEPLSLQVYLSPR